MDSLLCVGILIDRECQIGLNIIETPYPHLFLHKCRLDLIDEGPIRIDSLLRSIEFKKSYHNISCIRNIVFQELQKVL